jgi:hypothetical protein
MAHQQCHFGSFQWLYKSFRGLKYFFTFTWSKKSYTFGIYGNEGGRFFEMKRQFGTGNPSNSEQEKESDEVDLVMNKMDELLLFNDSDGEFDE